VALKENWILYRLGGWDSCRNLTHNSRLSGDSKDPKSPAQPQCKEWVFAFGASYVILATVLPSSGSEKAANSHSAQLHLGWFSHSHLTSFYHCTCEIYSLKKGMRNENGQRLQQLHFKLRAQMQVELLQYLLSDHSDRIWRTFSMPIKWRNKRCISLRLTLFVRGNRLADLPLSESAHSKILPIVCTITF